AHRCTVARDARGSSLARTAAGIPRVLRTSRLHRPARDALPAEQVVEGHRVPFFALFAPLRLCVSSSPGFETMIAAPQPVEPLSGGIWDPQRRRLTAGLVLIVSLTAFEALAVATAL